MSNETYLSQHAYERLQSELEKLRTEGRTRISQEIETARAHGDLSENAEYDAAKEEQGKMEARIRQLESLLANAKVGEVPPPDEVAPGLLVTLDVNGEVDTYYVAASREDKSEDHVVLSTSSPIGASILGAKEGDAVTADVPAGQLDITVKTIKRP